MIVEVYNSLGKQIITLAGPVQQKHLSYSLKLAMIL